jgi:hypothetical protein
MPFSQIQISRCLGFYAQMLKPVLLIVVEQADWFH